MLTIFKHTEQITFSDDCPMISFDEDGDFSAAEDVVGAFDSITFTSVSVSTDFILTSSVAAAFGVCSVCLPRDLDRVDLLTALVAVALALFRPRDVDLDLDLEPLRDLDDDLRFVSCAAIEN